MNRKKKEKDKKLSNWSCQRDIKLKQTGKQHHSWVQSYLKTQTFHEKEVDEQAWILNS